MPTIFRNPFLLLSEFPMKMEIVQVKFTFWNCEKGSCEVLFISLTHFMTRVQIRVLFFRFHSFFGVASNQLLARSVSEKVPRKESNSHIFPFFSLLCVPIATLIHIALHRTRVRESAMIKKNRKRKKKSRQAFFFHLGEEKKISFH
jgi:hypothetical protein